MSFAVTVNSYSSVCSLSRKVAMVTAPDTEPKANVSFYKAAHIHTVIADIILLFVCGVFTCGPDRLKVIALLSPESASVATTLISSVPVVTSSAIVTE